MISALHLDGATGRYLDWGFLHLSVSNLAIIATMVVLFVLALVLPFPHAPERARPDDPSTADGDEGSRR
mgnify:CR=1 FL=1